MPGIAAIVAMAENGVIGRGGDMPWHLPADLAHFRRHTLGKAVILGRRTFDSICARIGGPLPGRTSIVLSTAAGTDLPGRLYYAASIDEALDLAVRHAGDKDEIMVAGGARVYRQMLPMVDKIYRTLIQCHPTGDCQMPDISDWRLCWQSPPQYDGGVQFRFEVLAPPATEIRHNQGVLQ